MSLASAPGHVNTRNCMDFESNEAKMVLGRLDAEPVLEIPTRYPRRERTPTEPTAFE